MLSCSTKCWLLGLLGLLVHFRSRQGICRLSAAFDPAFGQQIQVDPKLPQLRSDLFLRAVMRRFLEHWVLKQTSLSCSVALPLSDRVHCCSSSLAFSSSRPGRFAFGFMCLKCWWTRLPLGSCFCSRSGCDSFSSVFKRPQLQCFPGSCETACWMQRGPPFGWSWFQFGSCSEFEVTAC